jgi:hypothetical protein
MVGLFLSNGYAQFLLAPASREGLAIGAKPVAADRPDPVRILTWPDWLIALVWRIGATTSHRRSPPQPHCPHRVGLAW